MSTPLDAAELRVLGSLIEKQRTTPDAYPLTLNALRAACSQSTNRDPVASYEEATVREALTHLAQRRYTRLAGAARAAKYRHLLDEALGLAPDELSVLAVLMLRGAQTPGELKQRSERLHPFADLAALEATLSRLVQRGLAAKLERRPGQKEERYVQLLGEGGAPAPATAQALPAAVTAEPPAIPAPDEGLSDRITRLEDEVAALRAELAALRRDTGA